MRKQTEKLLQKYPLSMKKRIMLGIPRKTRETIESTKQASFFSVVNVGDPIGAVLLSDRR